MIWKQPGTCLRTPENNCSICYTFLKKSSNGKITHYCAKKKLLHPLNIIKQTKVPSPKWAATPTVAAECSWLCMFSSSDSGAASHSCKTGVMILVSFICSHLKMEICGCFKNQEALWAAWAWLFEGCRSHIQRPGAPSHRRQKLLVWTTDQAMADQALGGTAHTWLWIPAWTKGHSHVRSHPLDLFVSPLLLKTCKSPTSEQSHCPMMHLSKIVTVWACQHYSWKEFLSWNISFSPSTALALLTVFCLGPDQKNQS